MKLTLAFILPLVVSGVVGGTLGRYARVVDSKTAANTTYDFIIVGAGIGGLTVADRLTEDLNSEYCYELISSSWLTPVASVLVVEYGPFDQGEDGVLIPGSYFPVPYFWPNIFSTPQVSTPKLALNLPLQVPNSFADFLLARAQQWHILRPDGSSSWRWVYHQCHVFPPMPGSRL